MPPSYSTAKPPFSGKTIRISIRPCWILTNESCNKNTGDSPASHSSTRKALFSSRNLFRLFSPDFLFLPFFLRSSSLWTSKQILFRFPFLEMKVRFFSRFSWRRNELNVIVFSLYYLVSSQQLVVRLYTVCVSTFQATELHVSHSFFISIHHFQRCLSIAEGCHVKIFIGVASCSPTPLKV